MDGVRTRIRGEPARRYCMWTWTSVDLLREVMLGSVGSRICIVRCFDGPFLWHGYLEIAYVCMRVVMCASG